MRASGRSCARSAAEPCTRTTAAPLFEGRSQPRKTTPLEVRSSTSLAAPNHSSTGGRGTAWCVGSTLASSARAARAATKEQASTTPPAAAAAALRRLRLPRVRWLPIGRTDPKGLVGLEDEVDVSDGGWIVLRDVGGDELERVVP